MAKYRVDFFNPDGSILYCCRCTAPSAITALEDAFGQCAAEGYDPFTSPKISIVVVS